MEYTHVVHTFGPVVNQQSRILILGSVPSVKSRETQFYYGHPQNRFWRVLAALFEEETPRTIEEKKSFLLSHGIALWDVIESCDIAGSSDSSIRNVTANDMTVILRQASIEAIYTNGGKAQQLYQRFCRKEGVPNAVQLPSTSPANAAWSIERLVEAWRQALAEHFIRQEGMD